MMMKLVHHKYKTLIKQQKQNRHKTLINKKQ